MRLAGTWTVSSVNSSSNRAALTLSSVCNSNQPFTILIHCLFNENNKKQAGLDLETYPAFICKPVAQYAPWVKLGP